MSIDLTSLRDDEGWFGFSNTGWTFILNLAEAYGWQPHGTALEDEGDWGGCYDSTDGQAVSDSDALQLAQALEAALQSLNLNKVSKRLGVELKGIILSELELPEEPEFSQGIDEKFVMHFIIFCRRSGFLIE